MNPAGRLTAALASMTGVKHVEKKDDEERRLINIGRSTENHTPGKKFQHPDGTAYIVGKNGAWKRLTARKCNRGGKDGSNNGVRRRQYNRWEKM